MLDRTIEVSVIFNPIVGDSYIVDRFTQIKRLNHEYFLSELQLSLTCVRVNRGICKVKIGMAMALLKCFPAYQFHEQDHSL